MSQAPAIAELSNGIYTARIVDSPMPYAAGAITVPAEHNNTAARTELLQAVLDNLRPVDPSEQPYTGCTDGRIPEALESGEPVPVREQLVGADIMTAFFMAEVLGPDFYADPAAPVEARLEEVAAFLGTPSTHIDCGAAKGYVPVSQNVVAFAAHPEFAARNRLFVGDGVYSDALFGEVIQRVGQLHDAGRYQGYDAELVTAAVRSHSGPRAVAKLRNDDRGVHGHVEEMKLRIRVRGVANDEARVAAQTGDREVFAVNDTRLEDLARRFSRGDDRAYALALIAGEAWTDAGHATLSDDTLPTVVIEAA